MKDKETLNVNIEYGDKDLKEILTDILKELYIKYITGERDAK